MTVKIGMSQALSSVNSNSVGVKSNNEEGNFLLALSNAIDNEKAIDLNNEITIEDSIKSNVEVEVENTLTENDEDTEFDEKIVELISGLLNNVNPKIKEKIVTNLKNIDSDNNPQVDMYITEKNVDNKQQVVDKLISYVENIVGENNVDGLEILKDIDTIKKLISNNEVKKKLQDVVENNNNLMKKENYITKEETNVVATDELEIMSNFRALSIKDDTSIDKGQNELNILNNIVMTKNNSTPEIKSEIVQSQVIRSEYISEDFVQVIKYLKGNNIEEISVKMNPKDLGELHIKILKSNNEEKIVVTLSNTDTFNLLKDKVNEIKNHLNTLDINVKEVAVEIKSGNQSDFSQDLSQQFNRNNNKEERKASKVISEQNNASNNSLEEDDININLLI